MERCTAIDIRRRTVVTDQACVVSNLNAYIAVAMNTLFSHLTGPPVEYTGIDDKLEQLAWHSFIRDVLRAVMIYGYVSVVMDDSGAAAGADAPAPAPSVIDGSEYVLIPLAHTSDEQAHAYHHTVHGSSSTTPLIPLFRTADNQELYEERHIYTFIVFPLTPRGDLTSPVSQCVHLHVLLSSFTANCVTADIMNSQAMAWETRRKTESGSITSDMLADEGHNVYDLPCVANIMEDNSNMIGKYRESIQSVYKEMRMANPPARAVLSTAVDVYATSGVDMRNTLDPTMQIPTAPDTVLTAVPNLRTRPDFPAITTDIAHSILHLMLVPPSILGIHRRGDSTARENATGATAETTWTFNLTLLATQINAICAHMCGIGDALVYLRSGTAFSRCVQLKRPLNTALCTQYPEMISVDKIKQHFGYGGDGRV
jgi:hypothetical protein